MRGSHVFAATAFAVTMSAGPALADATYPPSNPPATVTVAPTTEVKGEQIVRPSPEVPFTGQDILALTLAGGAAIVVGTGLVIVVRRRRSGGEHT